MSIRAILITAAAVFTSVYMIICYCALCAGHGDETLRDILKRELEEERRQDQEAEG